MRKLEVVADAILASLSLEFEALCARTRAPVGLAPEQLLRAPLLRMLNTLRSERQRMERLEFDLLFCCSVRLGIDDKVWPTSAMTLPS